jgi:hypothetical protein
MRHLMTEKEAKYNKLFICPLVDRMGKCKNTAGEHCAHRIPHYHMGGCNMRCDAGHKKCEVYMYLDKPIPEIYF